MKYEYDLNELNEYKNNKDKNLDVRYLQDEYNIYNIFYVNNLSNLNVYVNLVELNFKNNRNLADNSISQLINLEKLILPKNKLITNKSLCNLNKIKYLDLSNNKILIINLL